MAQTAMQKVRAECTSSTTAPTRSIKTWLDHWADHGDWEPLAYLLKNHRDAPLLRRISGYVLADGIDVVLVGRTPEEKKAVKASKHGILIIKPAQIKPAQVRDAEGYKNLEYMVTQRIGVTAKIEVTLPNGDVKKVVAVNHFFPTVSVKSERAPADIAKSYMKSFCAKYGMSESMFIAILSAKTADVAAVSNPATPLVMIQPATDNRVVDHAAH